MMSRDGWLSRNWLPTTVVLGAVACVIGAGLLPGVGKIESSALWLTGALLFVAAIIYFIDENTFRANFSQALITFMSVFAGAYVATVWNAVDRDDHERETAKSGVERAFQEANLRWDGYAKLFKSYGDGGFVAETWVESLKPIPIAFYVDPVWMNNVATYLSPALLKVILDLAVREREIDAALDNRKADDARSIVSKIAQYVAILGLVRERLCWEEVTISQGKSLGSLLTEGDYNLHEDEIAAARCKVTPIPEMAKMWRAQP